ncbi:phosphoribosyltransferase [Rhodococcus globerulus]|uniref:Phosphoribosyltransferase family protein n=1 Tax=Rhodococcus globerulus TaxID=33008 RepID=A0ABU4C1Q0_RHOGO|nr:phosphoribosyltransferase family protein [Rhodococcus globerulus]MDV6270430.1 phosphoribosyltransferase family protein [Rhodococcus globerulus]
MAQYRDRFAAGRALAAMFARSLDAARLHDPVVLGLPRGGVPVAIEVASALDAPLDILVVRKLGSPRNPELALGAIGEGDTRVLNHDVIAAERVSPQAMARVEESERAELERRAHLLRAGRPAVPLSGRTAVIVDDGMATGASAAVASACARAQGATGVIVAVPVASPESIRLLADSADRVICPFVPAILGGVGAAFDDFHQLTDSEVVDLLEG